MAPGASASWRWSLRLGASGCSNSSASRFFSPAKIVRFGEDRFQITFGTGVLQRDQPVIATEDNTRSATMLVPGVE